MPVGNSHATQVLSATSDAKQAAARQRLRQAAYHLAADCDYLLDELSRVDRPEWSQMLTRTLVATRRFVALTGPELESYSLFDADLKPSARLVELHERILTATQLAPSPSSGRDEKMLAAMLRVRETARALLSGSGDSAMASPQRGSAGESAAAVVLVVDDDPAMAALVTRAVRRLGHEAVLAEDGRAALTRALEGGIDLILTDIDMPTMTGLELLEALKADPVTSPIPTIVISGNGEMTKVAKCIEMGAVDHLMKPFEFELLRARITKSLENRRMHLAEAAQRVDVARLIAAAVAVENDAYAGGSLDQLAATEGGLGQLARVFDRMVSGLRTREDRLRQRLQHLRKEVESTRPRILKVEAPKDEAFRTGALVAGRYEVRHQLGEGGMGTVYSAHDQQLNEDVVLKVVRPDLLKTDPSLVARLKSELRLARRISHRNVVRAYDIGEWEGRHFITMELVRGVSIAELLDERGRLSIGSTLAIATQLAEALAVAHESEIIHRDIKPANLLVDGSGTLKVMDFGIARQIEVDRTGITAHGFVVGTPQYMAPELLVGGVATFRTDLFAVGVLIYECLTGRIPHGADSPAEMISKIYNGTVAPVESIVPETPKALSRLVHQQLSYDPEARIASARELAGKLGEIEYSRD